MIQAAIRGLECNVKKADVQKLMYQYSKENDGEIDSDEFLQISKCQAVLVMIILFIILMQNLNCKIVLLEAWKLSLRSAVNVLFCN